MTNTAHTPPCPDILTENQREQYLRDGYLAFAKVLSHDEVEAARSALSELVLRTAHDPAAQKRGTFWTPSGSKLAVQFEAGCVPSASDDPELELKVRKLMWLVDEHPHLEFLARVQQKIQGVLRALLQDEPILYQDMALVKPPFIGGEKPWHQDNAYFSATPLEAVCGVWVALDAATARNGCMHVIPGGHRLGALRHHHDRDCEIVPDRLANQDNILPVELPPGGAMFFSGMLPHHTPPNASPDRRRALQFHYRAASSTIVPTEEYSRVFAEADGTPASCAAAVPRNL